MAHQFDWLGEIKGTFAKGAAYRCHPNQIKEFPSGFGYWKSKESEKQEGFVYVRKPIIL